MSLGEKLEQGQLTSGYATEENGTSTPPIAPRMGRGSMEMLKGTFLCRSCVGTLSYRVFLIEMVLL